jgi:hypothetical protein
MEITEMRAPIFVVTADGSVGRPMLTIALRSGGIEGAKEETQRIAIALTPAGYYAFSLFQCATMPDGGDVLIKTFHSHTKIEVI